MSVHLVGGTVEPVHGDALLAPFLAEAAARAGDRPLLVVLVVDHQGSVGRVLPAYEQALGKHADLRVVPLRPQRPVDDATRAEVAAADGVVVCSGPTPAYHEALTGPDDLAGAVRAAVLTGAPYAGFSAGAMVAGDQALLGGHLVDGREVCEEGCSEGLTELTVRPGLGLVPFTTDVHVTAAGTLGRAIELAGCGLVPASVGLDEDTCLTVAPGAPAEEGSVTGTGSAWLVRALPVPVHGEAWIRRVPGSERDGRALEVRASMEE